MCAYMCVHGGRGGAAVESTIMYVGEFVHVRKISPAWVLAEEMCDIQHHGGDH